VYMTRCTDLSGNGEGYVTFFVMKYDSSGNMLWADPTTGGNYTAITSFASAPYSVIEGSNNICLDANGYIYVTGAFTTPIIVFGNDTLNNVGSTSNIFVVKYDPSGNVVWAKNAGGTGGGIGTSLTVGANGNIYVTGVIYGGTTTFGNFSITTISGSDAVTCAFVAEYDPWGHVMWVQNYGQTTDGSLGISISADAKGDVYVTGDYPEGTIAFGNDTLSNTNDAYNIFTAKLVDTTLSGYLLFDQNICGNICNDSDIMFNPVINGGTPPYTFLWQSTGDSLSCYNCINPTVNITKASVFAVTVIDGNNRSFTDSVFLQSCSHVINDITNLNQQHLITVYPNPTSGKVYFDGVQTGYTLQVYNVLGEIISSSVVDHDNYGVNLSDKAKGMYFYRIADGAKLIQQGKIVVE